MIAGIFNGDHLGRCQAKQEEVFVPDGISDLDIRAVQSPDRERAIHGELHVSSSGCLFAGGGYLLAQVGRGIDFLSEREL